MTAITDENGHTSEEWFMAITRLAPFE